MSSTVTSESLPSDVNRGPELLVVSWVTVSIALLLVSLRYFIRGVLRKNLDCSDHLILIAAVSYISSELSRRHLTDKLYLGICYRADSPVQLAGPEWVRSEYPIPYPNPDTKLGPLHTYVHPDSYYGNRIGQDLRISVHPPSCARHRKMLSPLDLGIVSIQYRRLSGMFLFVMFPMQTASRIVGPKHQSTVFCTK